VGRLRIRSRRARAEGLVARGLRHAGYRVENLDGGMKAWARVGLPLDPPGGRVLHSLHHV
jgi:rhodanese-related sulfurtransferase